MYVPIKLSSLSLKGGISLSSQLVLSVIPVGLGSWYGVRLWWVSTVTAIHVSTQCSPMSPSPVWTSSSGLLQTHSLMWLSATFSTWTPKTKQYTSLWPWQILNAYDLFTTHVGKEPLWSTWAREATEYLGLGPHNLDEVAFLDGHNLGKARKRDRKNVWAREYGRPNETHSLGYAMIYLSHHEWCGGYLHQTGPASRYNVVRIWRSMLLTGCDTVKWALHLPLSFPKHFC